jgi:uncharacterized protein (DUF58 family)
MSAAPQTEPAPAWSPTRAVGRAVLVCGALILVGVVLGRIDLVVLATPFAVGTAWALRRRPTKLPAVAVEIEQEESTEGSTVRLALETSNQDSVPLDLVVGRLSMSAWLTVPGGVRPYAGELPPGATNRVELAATTVHWGQPEVGPAVAYGVAGDGLLVSGLVSAEGGRVRVLPLVPPFRADETMPRLSAMVGVHRSRRPGEGGEFAGVRRYGPGDRLRRIDWRVTLRTGEPHVAHTYSDRDAEVVVLLDVLREAGISGDPHGPPSVVDTTVRAAAAIAEHYLRQGDRVGLVEYSGRSRHLRIAGGRRHLHAVLDWLLNTRATKGAGDSPAFGIDPTLIPSSAVVIVLTPLLGPESVTLIATLARAGRSVVAVDTLGALADRPAVDSPYGAIAQRIWRLERENLVGRLREAGVPVTAWAGAGSLDEVLRDMERMAAAPKLGRR